MSTSTGQTVRSRQTTDAVSVGNDLRARLSEALAGTSQRALETLALGVGGVSFVLAASVAALIFGNQSSQIAGPDSIGQFTAIATTIVAFLAFVAGRFIVRDRTRAARIGILGVIDVVALAFAHASIASLSWTLLAVILEKSFIGAEVFAFPTLLVGGATAAITAYVVFYSATHFDLQLLAVVLAVFLVEGVIVSMLTASDPSWWRDDLSALGMTNSFSSPTFNVTLIVGGIIVTTLARYATATIPTAHARGVVRVRRTLIVVGVLLGLVGVFPVDQFHAIHTGFASGMMLAFGTLVIFLPWWIPEMPRAFVWLGWLFVAAILFLAILFATGYYTLTAVELIAGILVFAWLILFIRNEAAVKDDIT